jgi:hypothetical protein
MLALVVGAVAVVLLMANKPTVVDKAATLAAQQPVTVLQVVVTANKAARLLDRAGMVLNQVSAPPEGMPHTLSKATPRKEVTNKVDSHKEASSKEVIRVVVAMGTNL